MSVLLRTNVRPCDAAAGNGGPHGRAPFGGYVVEHNLVQLVRRCRRSVRREHPRRNTLVRAGGLSLRWLACSCPETRSARSAESCRHCLPLVTQHGASCPRSSYHGSTLLARRRAGLVCPPAAARPLPRGHSAGVHRIKYVCAADWCMMKAAEPLAFPEVVRVSPHPQKNPRASVQTHTTLQLPQRSLSAGCLAMPPSRPVCGQRAAHHRGQAGVMTSLAALFDGDSEALRGIFYCPCFPREGTKRASVASLAQGQLLRAHFADASGADSAVVRPDPSSPTLEQLRDGHAPGPQRHAQRTQAERRRPAALPQQRCVSVRS